MKQAKKLTARACIIALLIAICSLLIVSCGDSSSGDNTSPPAHTTHTWGAWVEKAATWNEDGERTRSCSGCTSTEKEQTYATGNPELDIEPYGDGSEYRVNGQTAPLSSTHLYIPMYYQGDITKPVTAITVDGFAGNGITEAVICANVEIIGDGTFGDCDELTTVTFKDESKLETIGDYAFVGCFNLKSITIPKGVTVIGDYAFANCADVDEGEIEEEGDGELTGTGLEEVIFEAGSKLKSLGEDAFAECYFLAAINLQAAASLEIISNNAFFGCWNLQTITIPASVTKIGDGAFNMCSDLKGITIPKSVTFIGYEAFNFCFGLDYIIFEEGSALKTIGDGAFCGTPIPEIRFPASLKDGQVGSAVFWNWSNEQTVYVPFASQTEADAAWGTGWRGNRSDLGGYVNVKYLPWD